MEGPRPALVVMARAPRYGAVKTRLAADIGALAAWRFYRETLRHTLIQAAAGAWWQTIVAVTPAIALRSFDAPPGAILVPQARGDLGARMQLFFDGLPPGPVVIIGTDLPGLRTGDIEAAFEALGQSDAVIGPAADGGYWLIGLKRRPSILTPFKDVRWSHQQTLNDTLRNLRGRSVSFLEERDDIDTGADYERWKMS